MLEYLMNLQFGDRLRSSRARKRIASDQSRGHKYVLSASRKNWIIGWERINVPIVIIRSRKEVQGCL